MIAVVKDDAYGHGASEVAHALYGRAQIFAVSTVEEGAALKTAGIGADVLVLTPPLCDAEAQRLVAYRMIATASSVSAIRLLRRAEEKLGMRARAHLAVNTGMNRYGVRPENVAWALREADGMIEGAFSHLYLPGDASAKEQAELFSRAAETVKERVPFAVCHLNATGGMLAGYESDAVRAGISLYGYLPQGFEGELAVRPAMKIYATVAHSGTQFGGGIGYALAQKKYGRIYTLRLGYGDGFFRSGGLGAEGNLCMDACVREGAAKFGERKLILSDVSEYAAEHGTTPYEVLVAVGRRALRVYV